MKKENKHTLREPRAEYNFSELKGGVRGKYAKRYKAGTNIVRLAPDVAEVFSTEKAVNDALRGLIKLAHTHASHTH